MTPFKLQADLNNIYKLCDKNAMHQNRNKCSTSTFSLKKNTYAI